MLKIVVLTNAGSVYGKKVLNFLRRQNMPIQAGVVIRQSLTYYHNLFQSVRQRVGWFDAIYFSFERLIQEARQSRINRWQGFSFIDQYEHLNIPIIYSRKTNSPQTIKVLEALAPDLIVLGQTGIVRDDILRIPKIGVLNAHPGLLPYYRGIDCAAWAILDDRFDRVGSTVHWVDRGIDTGNILIAQPYVFKGDEKIHTLTDRLYDQCVELLAQVIGAIKAGQVLPSEAQKRERGKQCYKISRRNLAIAQTKLEHFIDKLNHQGKEHRYDC